MKTLRGRLLRTLTITLVALFLAEWLLLGLAIRRVSEENMLTHLEHDGEGILASLRIDGAQVPTLEASGIEAVYDTPLSGHYFTMQAGDAPPLRSASLQGHAMRLEAPSGPGWRSYHAPGPADQWLLVRASTHRVGGRDVVLYVAEDTAPTTREIWRLSLASLALFALLFVGALFAQALAVSRALRPLLRLSDELREVGAGRHAQVRGDVPAEVRPLVDELNRLLAQLHRRLKQSRSALGNLAHALKTPLALLFRTAESPGLPPDVHRAILEQSAAIRRRLELELRRARLAGPMAGGAGAWFDPSAELSGLVAALSSIHSHKGLVFELDASEGRMPFDREDMLELIGNLADNACKWATHRVTISARPDESGSLRVVVADDGPGMDASQIASAMERGTRLDESTPGHGLGLAIVRDIVELHGGTLQFRRDPALGGLRAEVVLPPSGGPESAGSDTVAG